jgi:hypothetical protein
VIALAAPALALLLASTASARIEVQEGIARIHLEDTAAAVIAQKGAPDADKIVQNEILGPQRKMRYGKTKVYFVGTDDAATVVGLVTKGLGQRTNRGVGVGSTEADVVAGVRRVKCRTDSGFRHCFRGRFRPGRRVTDFAISPGTGRVSRVTVAFVID